MVKFGKRIAYTKSYGKGMRSMEKGKKKKIAVIVGIIVLIIVIAAVVFAFYANSKKSSAEDAALQHAGVTRQEAAMLQSELDFKGFSIVCDVSFMIMRYLCRVWKFSILRKNITEFLLCHRAILPPADRKTGLLRSRAINLQQPARR